jgi:hypothetical protein
MIATYKIISGRWSADEQRATLEEIKQQSKKFDPPATFERRLRNGMWMLVDNTGDAFATEDPDYL